MSTIVSLLILLLCLPLHACHARPFGVIDEGSSKVQFRFSGKVAEKVKLLGHVNSPIERGTNIGNSIVDSYKRNQGFVGATTQEPKDSIRKLSGTKHAGTEIFESSSNVNLLNKATSTTEEWRRRAILVESGTHLVKDAVELGSEKADQKEAVVTDYNPPRQTPPVHN